MESVLVTMIPFDICYSLQHSDRWRRTKRFHLKQIHENCNMQTMCSITTCGFFFSLLEKREAPQAVGFGMSLLMVSCGSVYTRTHMYTTHVPIYLCVSDCLHNVYYRNSEHKIHSGVLDMYPLNTAGFGA